MTGDPIPDGGIEIPLRFTGLEEGRTSADAIFNSLTSNADRLQSRLDSFRTQMMELGRATNPWMAARTMGSSISSPEERLRAVGYSAPSSDINLQNLLSRSLHPTSGSSSSSPWLSMTTREGEGLADVFRRLRTAGGNLGDVLSDSGKRVAGSAKAAFDVFRSSAFGRSLGLRSIGPDGKLAQLTPDSFARALGRFMAARSVGGLMNAGFEYAKNPLHDNFAINRAQKATNNVINTLATTGSPTAAIISGLSSVIMSNIERRNELHTMRYNFDQASIDTRRSVAAQGSDWAFNQIKGMYSRPEQIRMLQERASVRRGTMVYDTEAIDQMQIPRPAEGIAKENAAMAELNKRFGFAEKYAALLPGSENAGGSPASSVENKAAEARKAAEEAGVKAADVSKEAAVSCQKASEKSKKVAEKEEKVADEKSKALDAELKAALESKPEYDHSLEGREKKLAKDEEAVARHEKRMREGHLAKRFWQGEDGRLLTDSQHSALRKKQLADDLKDLDENGRKKWGGYSKDTFKEVTEQDILNQTRNRIAKERQDIADSRAEAENKRSERINAAYDAKEAYEAQKRQEELDKRIAGRDKAAERAAENSRKLSRGETVKIEHDEKWYKDRNLDPKTGKSLIAHDPAAETAFANGKSVVANSSKVSGAASKAKAAADEAADGFTVNNPLPVRYNFEKGRRAKLEDEVKAEEEGEIKEAVKKIFPNGHRNLPGNKTFKELLGDIEVSEKLGNTDTGIYRDMIKVRDAYLSMSGNKRGQLAGYDKNLIDEVHKGNFKNTDMATLKEALDIAKANGIDFDKDKNFAKIRDVYQQQERLAEAEELQAKQLKYDPSQIMNQYMEAGRVNDSMSRQGFFIGAQVDVQDVNRDILAEVKKAIPLLSKMASKEVGISSLGLSPDSTFK